MILLTTKQNLMIQTVKIKLYLFKLFFYRHNLSTSHLYIFAGKTPVYTLHKTISAFKSNKTL